MPPCGWTAARGQIGILQRHGKNHHQSDDPHQSTVESNTQKAHDDVNTYKHGKAAPSSRPQPEISDLTYCSYCTAYKSLLKSTTMSSYATLILLFFLLLITSSILNSINGFNVVATNNIHRSSSSIVVVSTSSLLKKYKTAASPTSTTTTRLYQRRQSPGRGGGGGGQIESWEREVRAGAQARVDMNRVTKLLDAENDVSNNVDETVLFAPPWQISLAAAACSGIFVSTVFHNVFLAMLCSGGVFYVAIVDPDDGISGALARLLGRATLRSVESSKPKIRAMARAALTNEEEISSLKKKLSQLQQENYELRRWKERKLAVDCALPNYSLDELKDLARQNNLPVGGNKSEILMRLAEAEVINFL